MVQYETDERRLPTDDGRADTEPSLDRRHWETAGGRVSSNNISLGMTSVCSAQGRI